MLKPYTLRLPTATAVLNDQVSYVSVRVCVCVTLYCAALYILLVKTLVERYFGTVQPP